MKTSTVPSLYRVAPLKEGDEQADKAAYDKIMAMITSTLKDPMATKKIGGELADAMGVPSQFTMKSVARKGPAAQAPGQMLSMKSIAREGQEEMDESDAGYSGWLPEAAQTLDEVVSWLAALETSDPKLTETVERLYTDVHDVSLRLEGLIKEFAAQNKEDEFILQLIHNFPIKPGFKPETVVPFVKNVLRGFGRNALDLVTDPQVWQQKVAAHYKDPPPEDIKKLVAVILRTLGA